MVRVPCSACSLALQQAWYRRRDWTLDSCREGEGKRREKWTAAEIGEEQHMGGFLLTSIEQRAMGWLIRQFERKDKEMRTDKEGSGCRTYKHE